MARRNKKYPFDQCALYRCSSKKKLFELIQTTSTKIKQLREAPDLYRPIKKVKKDGSLREVLAPRGDLKRIQSRVAELLLRLETPNYLMAPVRGRSNIDNAAQHRGARSFHLLDVEDFFPSCSTSKVAHFFGKVMKCPPDVAKILVEITTRNGSLPTGSPASPSLAFWAYKDMWDEIDQIVRAGGCDFTVYIDDITISGPVVRGSMIHCVKQRLKHHGHNFHPRKEASQVDGNVEATGVILRPGGKMALPNRQHLEIHKLRNAMQRTPPGPDQEQAAASLMGRNVNLQRIMRQNRE